MNILICGDSFAADHTVKYKSEGWPNMLAKIHPVTNLAQAGCSQYKILKQLESVDPTSYDRIIISQTSPYRLYVKNHPIHSNDKLHKDCDLIYSDIKEHSLIHEELLPIVEYFEKYFDFEYANYIHTLLCEKIERMLLPLEYRVIHIITFENSYQFKNAINFTNLKYTNKGLINHYDDNGNKQILNKLIERIGVTSGIRTHV